MIRARFSELSYPSGLGLSIISEYLTDAQMEELIFRYRDVPRKKRRVILPPRVCVRKVYLHFLYKKIIAGLVTWKDLSQELKERFGTLYFARMTLTHLKEAHYRREREIKLEIK